MSSPAMGRRPIVKRIVIDVSVVSVEAIVAGIGAAIAPIVAVPAGASMTFAIDRPEICRRRRSAGTAENRGGNCSRNKKTFHDHAQSLIKPPVSLTNRGHDANQNGRIG